MAKAATVKAPKTVRKKRIDRSHTTRAALNATDETLALDIEQMLFLRAAATDKYKAAAQQEESIIRRMELAGVKVVTLKSGSAATLIDNFATANVAWKSAKMQRFEVKIVA
jgi:hypothetical protein